MSRLNYWLRRHTYPLFFALGIAGFVLAAYAKAQDNPTHHTQHTQHTSAARG